MVHIKAHNVYTIHTICISACWSCVRNTHKYNILFIYKIFDIFLRQKEIKNSRSSWFFQSDLTCPVSRVEGVFPTPRLLVHWLINNRIRRKYLCNIDICYSRLYNFFFFKTGSIGHGSNVFCVIINYDYCTFSKWLVISLRDRSSVVKCCYLKRKFGDLGRVQSYVLESRRTRGCREYAPFWMQAKSKQHEMSYPREKWANSSESIGILFMIKHFNLKRIPFNSA